MVRTNLQTPPLYLSPARPLYLRPYRSLTSSQTFLGIDLIAVCFCFDFSQGSCHGAQAGLRNPSSLVSAFVCRDYRHQLRLAHRSLSEAKLRSAGILGDGIRWSTLQSVLRRRTRSSSKAHIYSHCERSQAAQTSGRGWRRAEHNYKGGAWINR